LLAPNRLQAWSRLANHRVFKFVATGGAATVTHVTVFVVLVEIFGVSPVVASVPAFLTALCVSYYGNRTFTFQSTGSHAEELPKYTIVAVSGLLMNISITYVVVDVLRLGYAVALLLVITGVPVVTFWLSKKWVFGL
jgi:putative flippase GtrA